MRIWLDPATAISAGAAIFSGIASMSGGATQSRTAINQGDAQAAFYEQQLPGVQRREAEAHIDLANERNASIGRAAAVSAAQGGDMDVGIVSAIAGKYGMMDERIKLDSEEQQWLLKSRASYARQAGRDAAQYGDAQQLRGVGSLAQGAYSLYSGAKDKNFWGIFDGWGSGGGGGEAVMGDAFANALVL